MWLPKTEFSLGDGWAAEQQRKAATRAASPHTRKQYNTEEATWQTGREGEGHDDSGEKTTKVVSEQQTAFQNQTFKHA